MQKTYYKFGEDGKMLSTLHLEESEGSLQENVTLTAPDFLDGQWPWMVDGVWQAQPIETYVLPVSEARRAAYPNISDQLDMLWHAMYRGDIAMAPAFYGAIKAVKDRYPYPEPVNTAYQMPE